MYYSPIMFIFKDLYVVLYYCFVFGLIFYATVLLRELFLAVKKFNAFYDNNTEKVAKLLEDSSSTLEKTNSILDSIDVKVKSVKEKMDDVKEKVDVAKDGISKVSSLIAVKKILPTVFKFLSKKK